MSDIAIRVENLSKRYLLGHQSNASKGEATLRDNLVGAARGLLRRTKEMARGGALVAGDSIEEFWALRDVSFEVKRGEVVGIIGRNGAGKSTLLKILSRITEPTSGRITLNGRVSSLLEVGTGFHPELSGRENIFLNGAILGMSRKEIQAKFDEIVDFAEVEKFLDTPVKRYSSGMYVRLAFAVAAHLEPEILIVDEVLAVGDVQFQKKCLGKMQSVAGQGRTILFVSHNMAAVEQLTQSAVLLMAGRMVERGPTPEVVTSYMTIAGTGSEVVFDVAHTPRKYPGNGKAQIEQLRFDRIAPIFSPGEPFEFIVRIKSNANATGVRISMTIFGADGVPIGSCFAAQTISLCDGSISEVKVTLAEARLAPGSYFCGLSVGTGDHKTGHVDFDVVLETLHFDVKPEEGDESTVSAWPRAWGSIMFSPLSLKVEKSPSLVAK